MSVPVLVIQYEGPSGTKQIAHLAVMKPGAISGHAYPLHEHHEQLARYLCTADTPAYSGWDELTADIIQKHDGLFCPKCFGSPFDGISTT